MEISIRRDEVIAAQRITVELTDYDLCSIDMSPEDHLFINHCSSSPSVVDKVLALYLICQRVEAAAEKKELMKLSELSKLTEQSQIEYNI